MFKKNLEDTIIAECRIPYTFHSAESGTSRLVRTVSKAFTSHGCEKSGVGGHFLTYLQDIGMKNHLITFRGHKFNHLFHAAGCTFYNISDICDFLQKWSEPNELLRSISFDTRKYLYLAGARALGLIDKLVTRPLWRIIEKVPGSLSLNTHLYQVKLNLEN
jgi:E1A/CREB-binding protein